MYSFVYYILPYYTTVKVDPTEHKMAMRVRLVKVSRHDILCIGDSHVT